MFDRFTDNAIKVIICAQEESRRLGHNYVGTEQLLLGLISVSGGLAGRTLKMHGINLRSAQLEVERRIGRGAGFVTVEIPFTPRAKQVLKLSCDEADRLKEATIHTEHLLLGLLRDEREVQGIAISVIEGLGVDPIAVGRTLNGMMRDYRLKNKTPVASNDSSDVLDQDLERYKKFHAQSRWYEILQVDLHAEFKVIFEAYIYLVNKYHPDSETGDKLRFAIIHQSWFILGDESLRSKIPDIHPVHLDRDAEVPWDEKTHYQILQVHRTAETALIAEVYRYLSEKYHPDRLNTGDEVKYELIKNAWMVISDETKRLEYDATLRPNNTETT